MNIVKNGLLTLTVLVSLANAGTGYARDVAELTRIYESFHAAAKAGDTKKMLSFYTPERQKEIIQETKTKDGLQKFLFIGRVQIPESYEVQHVKWNKDGATLYLLMQLPAMKEMERPRMRQEVAVYFKDIKGWKLDMAVPQVNPDEIKRSADLSYDPQNAETGSQSEIGGRIVRADFKPDCTMVTLRIMDEEHAVFLPPKQVLQDAGVNLSNFEPWKMYQFSGSSHKSDKYKFFADSGSPVEE